jgi:hypothetical protein
MCVCGFDFQYSIAENSILDSSSVWVFYLDFSERKEGAYNILEEKGFGLLSVDRLLWSFGFFSRSLY